MKRILIIGAGFGQIPAIKKAKELGIETICIDRNPSAIGFSICDYPYEVDVVDFEQALKIAEKHSVDGVMTMQSDLPVPTIGFINDKLNLNGVSLEVANTCSNKVLTRRKLALEKCSQPLFNIITSKDEAINASKNIGYPCVIKAPDSSGSRGVVKVNSPDEVSAAFDEAVSYSRGKEIIVEEYISGLEFGAQTFSINGKCEIVILHNDTMSSPPFMIPIGHSLPFNKLNEKETLAAIDDIKKAVNAVGISNGPANIDLILDEKSKTIKVIEIGARIGATCLPELVTYNTGKNWVELTILNAIGEKIDSNIEKNNPVAALIIESPKDGIFKGIKKEIHDNELLEFEITAQIGEKVSTLKKGTDRIGKIIVKSHNVEQAEKLAFKLREELVLDVE
jgi:biotin carboxylase